MKIFWSPLSIKRVQEISDYIAMDSPIAALNWVDALFDKVEILKVGAEIGRKVPELNRNDVRELIFGNYRIIYRILKNKIAILTVRHFKQILPLEDILL
jgi:plasmid stabilization system protein ParE